MAATDPVHAHGIVWLIGLMGAGKTTVGRQLAQHLGWPFVDLDEQIEALAGTRIAELFETEGEASFRARERVQLDALCRGEAGAKLVVAAGGGTPCQGDALEKMRHTGLVIWLRAEISEILPDLDVSERPLLAQAHDPAARLTELAALRQPYYEQADLIVDRRGRPIEAVAEELADWLAAFGAAPLGAPPLGAAHQMTVPLGERSYQVVVDPQPGAHVRFAQRLARLAPPGRTRIGLVTDDVVARLHAQRYLQALAERGYSVAKVIVPPPSGERQKTLEHVGQVAETLVQSGLDRHSILVALGGGVIGDLAGFVAAILYRGIRFVQVPTTLLAQVDASVGGKTGVNLPSGKNLVGSFHQPMLVYSDVTTLATLDPRDLSAGLGEVAKHALLAGDASLEQLERDAERAHGGDAHVLADLVARSCAFKAQVIVRDEREQDPDGGRALLNLGHTVGHALERASQGTDTPLRHGEAVGLGLLAAARVARALGEADLEPRIANLLGRLGLPVAIDRYLNGATLGRMAVDKKRAGDRIRFVVLAAPGRARLVGLTLERLRQILHLPEVT